MVSVFVLSWNHEKFIAQALQSIINQTYKDVEIIFLDNNSADNTYNIGENILKQSGVRYKAFKRNEIYSIAQNHNFLFRNSEGEYVCIISGDDWLHEKNIEEKLKIFENAPSLALVDSGGYKYYDDLNVYEPIKVKLIKKENVLTELLQRNFISGVGCVIKRKVIEDVGLWDESLLIEDTDMWIRIAQKYEIIRIDEPLFYYRQHAKGISKNFEFMYKGKMEVYNKFKHLNNHQKQTKKNIWETYIAAKVMQKASPAVAWEILKKFQPNKLYIKLLIKSLLPVPLKKWYFEKSLIKRNKHIKPTDQ